MNETMNGSDWARVSDLFARAIATLVEMGKYDHDLTPVYVRPNSLGMIIVCEVRVCGERVYVEHELNGYELRGMHPSILARVIEGACELVKRGVRQVHLKNRKRDRKRVPGVRSLDVQEVELLREENAYMSEQLKVADDALTANGADNLRERVVFLNGEVKRLQEEKNNGDS